MAGKPLARSRGIYSMEGLILLLMLAALVVISIWTEFSTPEKPTIPAAPSATEENTWESDAQFEKAVSALATVFNTPIRKRKAVVQAKPVKARVRTKQSKHLPAVMAGEWADLEEIHPRQLGDANHNSWYKSKTWCSHRAKATTKADKVHGRTRNGWMETVAVRLTKHNGIVEDYKHCPIKRSEYKFYSMVGH